MAKAFKSQFFGFDYHDKSIEAARETVEREGVSDRVTFEVAEAEAFPGKDYDFVAVFDCLHDMGDPVGAAKHVRQSIAKDGTWMIVEPFANDDLKDKLNRWPGVLLVFDASWHAMLTFAGSGTLPWCASGREARERGSDFGGIHPFSSIHGNTIQHRV